MQHVAAILAIGLCLVVCIAALDQPEV